MTTRKGNESIVQKENCFVEEIKEVELRSPRGKFIYNRTYNPVGLNKVSHFSRRGRAPSKLPMKKLKSLLWIGTYCISCVVQQRSRVKDLSSLVGYDES